MKKSVVLFFVSFLTVLPSLAVENPDRYELGQYNFNFDKAEISAPSATVSPYTPTEKTNMQPVSTKNPTQKEIIEKVKQEEIQASTQVKKEIKEMQNNLKEQQQITKDRVDVLKNNAQKNLNNYNNSIKKDINTSKETVEKTKNQLQQSIKQNQKSQVKQQEKPVKFDPNNPPFRFQIREMKYDAKSSSQIERL